MVKIKYVLLGMFISFSILLIVVFISAFIRINDTIYIKDVEKYTDSIVILKEKIDKLDVDDTCKQSFNSIIDRVNSTHFSSGEITAKEYYEAYFKNDETFLDYYQDIKDNCGMEENSKIYGEALIAYSYPYQVKNNYYLSYEFKIGDIFNSKDLRKEEQELNSFSTKYMELIVINDLLEVLE